MGAGLTDAVWIFAAVIAAIVIAAAALASRRYLLERSGGTVECGLRLLPAGNWHLGVAAYKHDELCWYRALGVLLRPEQVFTRRALSVRSRRPADLAEAAALGADRIVIEVSTAAPGPAGAVGALGAADVTGAAPGTGAARPAGPSVELAMTEQALTGFLAWLEASPPGSHLADLA